MASDSVIIVGGGISGLTTAYYLGKAGIRSTIIEKANRLGGLIKTDRIHGCELEAGPDSYLSTKTAVADLARELGGGLSEKIIESNDAERRIFVVRNGKLTPFPKAMSMMVPGEWEPVLKSPLLSLRTKLQLLFETLKKPRTRAGDFSVGELVSTHFGPEMLEYVTEPLLCGVYGGDSGSLSARSVLPRFVGFEEQYGSLIKGVRKSAKQTPQQGSLFRSFQGGMQTLVEALAKAVQEHTAVIYGEVTKVENADGRWRVRFGSESISSRQVVVACQAWAAASLLEQSAAAVASELAAIPYSSCSVAMLVFDRKELNHPLDGFGFLVPRREQQTMAAATWVNTKFPARIADGMAALRAFMVGPAAEAMAQMERAQIVATVRRDFERLMGFEAAPVFDTVNAWPKSMPQYVVGHEARVQRLSASLKPHAGLHLTGNYLDGVGIPDCVRRAKDVAKQIRENGVYGL
jgi:oxygen-dependent protoporphyrinogen oxidase